MARGLRIGYARQVRVWGESGSYAKTGYSAGLVRNFPLIAAAGSYAVSGQVATFSITGLPFTASVSSPSQNEGNSGTTNMTFTVSISAVQATNVLFDYETIDGTATAGSDYTAVSGTKTITAGTTSQTVDVPIIGDTTDESNETFTLRAYNFRFA